MLRKMNEKVASFASFFERLMPTLGKARYTYTIEQKAEAYTLCRTFYDEDERVITQVQVAEFTNETEAIAFAYWLGLLQHLAKVAGPISHLSAWLCNDVKKYVSQQ